MHYCILCSVFKSRMLYYVHMSPLVYLLVTIFYGAIVWVLISSTFHQWLKYKQAEFVKNFPWITLEIRLPREITKSPAAMEAVLEAFQQGGGTFTWWDRYRKGNLLNWFSLEIASFGGDIHFYIRTHKKFKNIIESYIYSQYPGVEILEVQDYTETRRYDPKLDTIFGSHFVLGQEDYLPIRTYIDYGLDKDPKEEFKTDPMTPMLEFMGSLKGNQQVWYQVLIRSDKQVKWKDQAKAKVAEMMMRTPKEGKEEDAKLFTENKLTQGEKDTIRAIERSTTKNGFEVFIQAIYITPNEESDSTKIASFMGMLKPFGSPAFNSFSPQDDTSFLYPWQDKKDGRKLIYLKQKAFKRFVLRSFGEYWDVVDSFSLSYEINSRIDKFLKHGFKYFKAKKSKSSFILNTEELATLYHFPGKVFGTPTFKRIQSTKSEAPSNLPI